MARKKGSKNKPKKVEEAPVRKTDEPDNVLMEDSKNGSNPIGDEDLKEGHSSVCKECKHPSDKHYGSEKKWCNMYFCQCEALK